MAESWRILLLSRYGALGASSRVRFYQYLPFLERAGAEVTVAPFFEDGYLDHLYSSGERRFKDVLAAYLRRIRAVLGVARYSAVWVEKEVFPYLPAGFETLSKRNGIPYVVDYDDAIFHNYDLHPRWAVRRFLGKKIDSTMADAAMVIVGNDYLGRRARESGAHRVEILPSVVDLSKYPAIRKKTGEGPFTIGWIGSPSTKRHLVGAESALKLVCRARGGKVVLIGAGENPFSGLMATICEWDSEREAEEISKFDVGIMPLPDNPWERGKCGFKLIQYMACGKPVVASPVGGNREIVVDGMNGFLASSDEEWVRALERLKSDPELRKTMGVNGRRMVEEKYCLQVTAPRLHRLLLEAAGQT